MLVAYKAHADFLIAELGALGNHPDWQASQANAIESFRDTLQSIPRDVVDGMNLMNELKKETAAFTEDHRRQISNDVAAHMRSAATISNAAPSPSHKLQSHPALADAYTKTLYDTLSDARVSWDDKLSATALHCVKVLGLKNPNDATCKQAVAIAAACSNMPLAPDDAYQAVFKFKAKIQAKRDLYPCPTTYIDFPKDVSVFMRAYPRAFPEYDPPVSSRVDALKISEMTRKENMPCRSSNRRISLKANAGNSSGAQPSLNNPESLIGRSLASYLLGNASHMQQPCALPGPAPPQPMAALADGTPPKAQPVVAPAASPTPPAGHTTSGIDDLLKVGGDVAAAKATLAAGKGKKTGKKKDKAAEESSDDSQVPSNICIYTHR